MASYLVTMAEDCGKQTIRHAETARQFAGVEVVSKGPQGGRFGLDVPPFGHINLIEFEGLVQRAEFVAYDPTSGHLIEHVCWKSATAMEQSTLRIDKVRDNSLSDTGSTQAADGSDPKRNYNALGDETGMIGGMTLILPQLEPLKHTASL